MEVGSKGARGGGREKTGGRSVETREGGRKSPFYRHCQHERRLLVKRKKGNREATGRAGDEEKSDRPREHPFDPNSTQREERVRRRVRERRRDRD